MKIINGKEYDAFVAEKLYLPVRIHNNVLDEDKYVLLDPTEVEKMDLNAIRDFIRSLYASKFEPNNGEFTIYYYGQNRKTL